MNMKCVMNFQELPLWTGVKIEKTEPVTRPFSISWDERGFIKQTTSSEVTREVVKNYADATYSFITARPGESTWGTYMGNKNINYIKEQIINLEGLNILEIGAGNLYLAEYFTTFEGVSKYTVIDPAVENYKVEKIEAIQGYFTAELTKEEKYDLVLSINCLEHIPDPIEFLKEIRTLLIRSQGKALLIFPDIEEQFYTGDLNALLHEHISYFSFEGMKKILDSLGLNIIKGETDGVGMKFLLECRQLKKISDINILEMDVLLPIGIANFQKNIIQIREEFREIMGKKNKVYFHGATNGLNNILYLTGLYNEENIFVIDSDEMKQGKYLPCCKNPILHIEDIKELKIETVYVSACSFFDSIEKYYIENHGMKSSSIKKLFENSVREL